MKQVTVSKYSNKLRATMGREYAITEKRYVGWVPEGTEICDRPHIVAGATMPYLLREVEDKELNGIEAVKLIGDAYVHGLMIGLGMYEIGILGETRELRVV